MPPVNHRQAKTEGPQDRWAKHDAAYFARKAAKEAASDKKWADFEAKQKASDAAYFKRKAAKGQ